MIAIAAASTSATSMAVPPQPARTTATPAAPAPRAEQPAVINDVASQGASGANTVGSDERPSALGGQVSRALENIGWYNASVGLDEITAWDKYEAKFGTARMKEAKQHRARALQVIGSLATEGVTELQRQSGVSGLSVTQREDSSMAMSEFSFKDAGSTYTIKQSTDGRMSGLKDGQGWKTWQVDPPASSRPASTGAAVALATLMAQPSGNTGTVPTDLLV